MELLSIRKVSDDECLYATQCLTDLCLVVFFYAVSAL